MPYTKMSYCRARVPFLWKWTRECGVLYAPGADHCGVCGAPRTELVVPKPIKIPPGVVYIIYESKKEKQ